MLKIFGTDGIRCRVNQEPMTSDTCLKIAKAAGFILSNKSQKKNRVIIISAIDNLIKGASGQAVQNMNVAFKLRETMGLL